MPHQSGTVKTAGGSGFTLTNAAGQDVAITVPADAKVLVVAPGAKSLAGATSGTTADVAPGDRAIVSGTPDASGTSMTAVRVILMKSAAIADVHAAEEAAWARGAGGIVKSVDAGDGTIVISNGLRTVTVHTTPQTIVKRYAPGSVRFEDAAPSAVAAIQRGDQMRVRGTRSDDGTSIQADAIVAGSFSNYSGLLTAVNVSAGTVTLKDLATKRIVTVAVTPNTDLRRLPPMAAQMIAARMRGTAGGPAAGGNAPMHDGAAGQDAALRTSRAGNDLSAMISRLPTETVAGLKPGDAVMMVATPPADGAGRPVAVTLLTGVDAILTAPSGETMTISPWNVGGGGGGDADGAGAGGGM